MNRKDTHPFKFRSPKLSSIKGLISDFPQFRKNNFGAKHGNLLTILNTQVDVWDIHTLVQYYDPPLRCFTFQDFQLAPTLEEFAHIIGINIKDQVPYTGLGEFPQLSQIAPALHMNKSEVSANLETKGGIQGFSMGFLVSQATHFRSNDNWVAFNDMLALLIYCIVLFPNIDDFVDMEAIRIFMLQNPVPTLLADVYHYVHWRVEKKGGMIQCCAPLLYRWFLSHLPKEGPFVENKDNLKWSKRVASLTADDISWYSRDYDGIQIIFQCGNFPNVPLIGTRGCINYNPVLALRQLGYPMEDKPDDNAIEGFFMGEGVKDFDLVKRIRKAWNKVYRKGRHELGKKNVIAREPYTNWVRERVSKNLLPYPPEPPMCARPSKPTHVSKEEADELHDMIAKLTKESEEWEVKFHKATGENMRLKRKSEVD